MARHEENASGQETIGRYERDANAADQYDVKLRRITKRYSSPRWRAIASARQGALYDELWIALSNVTTAWDEKKAALLAGASQKAVSRYASAVALARFYGVASPQIEHAVERLVALTAALGDGTMREYVTHTQDPRDASGSAMLTYTRGMQW